MDLLDLAETDNQATEEGVRVVDFARFRARHARRDADNSAQDRAFPSARPDRPLSSRQVEHRLRMLHHLTLR